jgi:hypothetical protein
MKYRYPSNANNSCFCDAMFAAMFCSTHFFDILSERTIFNVDPNHPNPEINRSSSNILNTMFVECSNIEKSNPELRRLLGRFKKLLRREINGDINSTVESMRKQIGLDATSQEDAHLFYSGMLTMLGSVCYTNPCYLKTTPDTKTFVSDSGLLIFPLPNGSDLQKHFDSAERPYIDNTNKNAVNKYFYLPDFMFILVGRDNFTLNTSVIFPDSMILKICGISYEIKSFVCYSGSGQSGHFTAYIIHNPRIYRFDDTSGISEDSLSNKKWNDFIKSHCFMIGISKL